MDIHSDLIQEDMSIYNVDHATILLLYPGCCVWG